MFKEFFKDTLDEIFHKLGYVDGEEYDRLDKRIIKLKSQLAENGVESENGEK